MKSESEGKTIGYQDLSCIFPFRALPGVEFGVLDQLANLQLVETTRKSKFQLPQFLVLAWIILWMDIPVYLMRLITSEAYKGYT